jgi:hypothetical protein
LADIRPAFGRWMNSGMSWPRSQGPNYDFNQKHSSQSIHYLILPIICQDILSLLLFFITEQPGFVSRAVSLLVEAKH